MTVSRTRAAALCALLATTSPFCLAAPALAQNATQPTPPRDYNIDGNGVDLVTGQFYMSGQSLTIGGAGGGLSYSRIRREDGYDDDYTTALTDVGGVVTVTIGGLTDHFTSATSADGTGATLGADAVGDYVYTTSVGVKYQFTKLYRSARVRVADQRVSTISHTDGRIVTIGYRLETKRECGDFGCSDDFQISRPERVTSSDGYQLLMTYRSNDAGNEYSFNAGPWMTLAGVDATNAAEGYCTSAPCANARRIAFSSDGLGNETTTDARGKQSLVTSDSEGRIVGVRPPGASTYPIAIDYDASSRVYHVTRGGAVWTYGYSDATVDGVPTRTTSVTSPTGLVRTVVSNLTLGKVTSDRSGSALPVKYDYYPDTLLKTVTWPEGDKTEYAYDTRDNLVKTTTSPKPSAPAGTLPIVIEAGYPADCTATPRMNCNKPLWTKDARRNQTDYTYSAVHGGVLTVTQPAPDASGVRPQTRYDYASFQARYYGPSGLINGPPIWKPTGTSQCAVALSSNAASCVGGASETRTDIVYPAAGTVSNLLPTSVTVRAGDNSVSATSAMGYDRDGNVTSVDGPLPGTDDTSYTRYNASRQVVGTISPDPDGAPVQFGPANPLKRRAVRVNYDDAGRTASVEQGTVDGVTDGDWNAFASLRTLTSMYDDSGTAATRLKIRDTLAAPGASGTVYALTDYKYDADRRPKCTAARMGTAPGTDACVQNATTDGADVVTQTDYGPDGRVATSWENGLQVARYTYTANGQVQSLTDARNNVTGYAYDGFDRATTTSYPAAGSQPATSEGPTLYDADGHVLSYTKRDGTVIGSTYDTLGRLTDQTLPSAANQANPHFGYDLMGRLTGASANNGTAPWINGMAYTVDALGRTTRQVTTLGNTASRTTDFRYDPAGRRERLTWSATRNYVDYVYWPTGELRQVRDVRGSDPEATQRVLATFDYNDLGDRVQLTRGNGLATVWTPDPASRLAGMKHYFPYDPSQEVTLGFGRDRIGRVGQRTMSNSDYRWTGYTAGTTSYTPNALNQYSAISGQSPGYDANGNMLQGSGSGLAYGYNAYDQLLSASNGTALAYAPLGRLAVLSSAMRAAVLAAVALADIAADPRHLGRGRGRALDAAGQGVGFRPARGDLFAQLLDVGARQDVLLAQQAEQALQDDPALLAGEGAGVGAARHRLSPLHF